MSFASEYDAVSVGGSTACVCVQVDGCERVLVYICLLFG